MHSCDKKENERSPFGEYNGKSRRAKGRSSKALLSEGHMTRKLCEITESVDRRTKNVNFQNASPLSHFCWGQKLGGLSEDIAKSGQRR